MGFRWGHGDAQIGLGRMNILSLLNPYTWYLFIIVSVQIMHVILSISHFVLQTTKFFFSQIVSSTSECSWLLYIDLVSYDLDKLSNLNSFSIDSFLFFHVHNHVTYKIKAVFFFHLPVLARTQHTHPGRALHLGHVWEEHLVLYHRLSRPPVGSHKAFYLAEEVLRY